MDLVPGQVVGNYRIVRPLGAGCMGAVYEVEHVELGVHYGLKTYILEDGNAELFRKRFKAEGKLLARLKHPNLVRVFDLDYDETLSILYYVMDLVLYKDGEAYTLDDLEDGGADEEHLVQWFAELCDALSYVHAQGIVHRDIKLNNILLAPERHVVLSDFGISRVVDERLRTAVDVTRTMVSGEAVTGKFIMGTAGYMAPEIERGADATPASDVYALGVVFFKLLTGVWYEPSLAPSANTGTGKMDAVQLLSHFEYGWKDVLPAMLDADPVKRPVDLRELAERVRGSCCVPRASCCVPRASWFVPRAWRVGIALLVLLIVAGVAAWLLWPRAAENSDDILEDAFEVPESVK